MSLSSHSKRVSSSSDTSAPNPRYQQSNQSTDQPTNYLSNHTSSASNCPPSHEPMPVSAGLLTYTFLLPLVVEYLNDGDVVARLLIVNKLIRRMLPKYSFKSMCTIAKAFEVIQASHDIVFSVTKVALLSSEVDQLVRLQTMNSASLNEVSYFCGDRSSLYTIPRVVTHLRLSRHISPDIDLDGLLVLAAGLIPDFVVDLDIGFPHFSLQPNSIPPSVTSLKLNTRIDKLDAAVIPDTVTDLTLIGNYLSSVHVALCGPFPPSLKRLYIPEHYLPFDAGFISPSITTIACNNKLLSVLEAGAIPISVRSVEVRWTTECVIKPGVLPESVTFLRANVNARMCCTPRWMPVHLTHLILSTHYVRITADMLPATLTHFMCTGEIEPGALPDGVTHVELFEYDGYLFQGVLPHSVTHLKLQLRHPNLTPGSIPPSVTHLELQSSVHQPMILGIIPDSVAHLAFVGNYQRLLAPGFVPQSVTHLILADDRFVTEFIPLDLFHTLPLSLTHLCFGHSFNHPVSSDTIPRTAKYLVFGHCFDQPILPGDIPPSVTHLAFAAKYTGELDSSNLPSSLTHLEIPRGYLKPDDKLWLPSSVTHISYQAKEVEEPPEMSWNNWSVDTAE